MSYLLQVSSKHPAVVLSSLWKFRMVLRCGFRYIHLCFMFTLFLEDYLVESSWLIFLRWVETTKSYSCHLGGRRSDFLLGIAYFWGEDVSFREGNPLLGRSARMFGWLSGAASVEYGNSGYPPVNFSTTPLKTNTSTKDQPFYTEMNDFPIINFLGRC